MIHKQVQEKLVGIKLIQLEERAILASLRKLESEKEEAASRPNLLFPKIQQAQMKIDELVGQNEELAKVLAEAFAQKAKATEVFQDAVKLRKDPNKSSKIKTSLNQKWLGIQQAKARAEGVYEKALEKSKAITAALSAQKSHLLNLKEDLRQSSQFDMTLMEEAIQDLKERVKSHQRNGGDMTRDMEVFSSAADQVISIYIEQNIDPENRELKKRVRERLQHLQRMCISNN